jgi:G3E family GTPase
MLTGVANPGPIITSLWTDEGDSTTRLQLDGVVTVVDCVNILSYLSSPLTSEDVKLQIAFADRILLNKIDIVDSAKVSTVSISHFIYCSHCCRIYLHACH